MCVFLIANLYNSTRLCRSPTGQRAAVCIATIRASPLTKKHKADANGHVAGLDFASGFMVAMGDNGFLV